MELNVSKYMTCRLAAKGRRGESAAAWMGLSFFLRMVYYFGLKNLNDVPVFEIIFSVVLPLAISVAFILMLKLQKLTHPVAAGGLAVAFAVNYFLAEQMNVWGVLSGILVLGVAGLILAAVLGYVPERKWLLLAGSAAIGFRVVLVDLFGYILPLSQWKLVAYIPRASNLFGVLAIACLGAALRLRKKEES